MLGIDTGEPIIDSWSTCKVMDLLDSEDLTYRFARRQVLSGKLGSISSFSVYNDEHAAIAGRIIEAFPKDEELRTHLEKQLSDYKVRSEQERKQKERATGREKEILQKMRKN
jgi:hypothetical protein